MASGDHCSLQKDPEGNATGFVIHRDCDDHGDGTITSVATGAVVRYRPKHWPVEEKAS
jgi:hypothetical protein